MLGSATVPPIGDRGTHETPVPDLRGFEEQLPRWARSRPVRGAAGYDARQRILDLTLVLVAVPIWLPLLAGALFAVWLSSPSLPPLYLQERTGRRGARFPMYKLRTMQRDAERRAGPDLLPHVDQGPGPKPRRDPRVTRLGRLLRALSLDELPQLINVLLGEMSLVGPRPTSFDSSTYRGWHRRRLEVRPGLTGLWQVLARGTTDFDTRVLYDLAYIERRGLRLDVAILLRTVPAVLTRRGAH